MADEQQHVGGEGFTWKPKAYRCPVHGVTEHSITSNIKGHEGAWCQLCWLDALDKMGVQRVTEAEVADG